MPAPAGSSGQAPRSRPCLDGTQATLLRRRIDRELSELRPAQAVASVVRSLLEHHGHRLAADCLGAVRFGRLDELELCRRIEACQIGATRNELLYALALARFCRSTRLGPSGEVVRAGGLEAFFAASPANSVLLLPEPRSGEAIEQLLQDVGGRLAEFIEAQPDLAKVGALVSGGVVKHWSLPDGTSVVSKRSNPAKPGAFEREQRNLAEVVRRLHDEKSESRVSNSLALSVVRPIALFRDHASDWCYAISRHVDAPLLEDILIDPTGAEERRSACLAHFRSILDHLFDAGIAWSDMAPCNMLVSAAPYFVTYRIFDFERTRFFRGPVPLQDRMQFCRDQVGYEETGVLCEPAELEACFAGYFDPASWDLHSLEPIRLPARPDIASMLHNAGLVSIPLGLYNLTDLAIARSRGPHRTAAGQLIHLGLINLRIEHYLSCTGDPLSRQVDRMIAEILIASREHGVLDAVAMSLDRAARCLETAFLLSELDARVNAAPRVDPPRDGIQRLHAIVGDLWAAKRSQGDLRAACEQVGCRLAAWEASWP